MRVFVCGKPVAAGPPRRALGQYSFIDGPELFDRAELYGPGGVTTESFGYTADGRLSTLTPGIGSLSGPAITSLDYNQAGQYAAAMNGSTALASLYLRRFRAAHGEERLFGAVHALCVQSGRYAAGRDQCIRCGAK